MQNWDFVAGLSYAQEARKCVSLLIEAGANKDQGSADVGATPLSAAAHQGHVEVVRFLVESGVNKDQGTTDTGGTPLFIEKRRSSASSSEGAS